MLVHQWRLYEEIFDSHVFPIESDTYFALNVLRQQDLSKPIVLSPLSITMSCASLSLCTEGKTKRQIVEAMFPSIYFSKSFLPYWIEKYNKMILLYESALIFEGNISFASHLHSIKDLKERHYPLPSCAKVVVTNFDEKAEAIELINDRMSKATRKLIKDIVALDDIKDDTDAILASGTQITGLWEESFSIEETTAGEFYSSPYSKRSVYYLSKQFTTKFAENDLFQVVRIKLRDYTFSLDVFLPRERFGLNAALGNLTMDNIQELFKKCKNKLVHVKIPKFRMETTLDLKDSLQAIGVRRVFKSGKAQFGTNRTIREKFGHLFDSNPTNELRCLSQMPHKAVFEIDEYGVNRDPIYAVSESPSSSSSTTSVSEKAVSLEANHPFMYMIVKHGHIIMMGVYN
ncbi:unnamed protein product [Caenorhabditis brenneri]